MNVIECGKPFTEELISKINTLAKFSGPKIAAFDADGTLWDNDFGEQFFQYQIDHCDLNSLKNIDPWDYYDTTKMIDPPKAYLWLAQISARQKLSQVRLWAKDSLNHFTVKPFLPQKNLIKFLKENNFKIYIVTASIKWAVEPGAHLMGLSEDDVIGIETEVENGVVTEKQKGPITWRQGKAEALLKATNGVRPLICSGNTYGDISLLELAQELKICIETQTEKNFLYEEEDKLRIYAKKHNWHIHKMT